MDESEQQLLHENTHEDQRTLWQPEPQNQISALYLTPLNGPMNALTMALTSGEYSDFTFVLGDREWAVHKVIICNQSKYFKELADKGINRVDLADGAVLIHIPADAEVVDKMVQFFYCTHYGWRNMEPDYSVFVHIKMFNLGVLYGIKDMDRLAANAFGNSIKNLRDLAVYFEAVEAVYSTPHTIATHPLRGLVVSVAIVELRKLLRATKVNEDFHKLIAKFPQFWVDVTLALLDANGVPGDQLPLCDDCGHQEQKYEIEVRCKGCQDFKTFEFN